MVSSFLIIKSIFHIENIIFLTPNDRANNFASIEPKLKTKINSLGLCFDFLGPKMPKSHRFRSTQKRNIFETPPSLLNLAFCWSLFLSLVYNLQ